MVCETAEELQARLAFRAIWPQEIKEGEADGDYEDVSPGPSLLHRRMRAELNEVLESSFKRRLKRIEQKVAILCEGGKAAANQPAASFAPPSRVADKVRPSTTAEVQTEEEESVSTQKLSEAFKGAMRRAALATLKPSKVFGPTKRQVALPDPKEEKEDLPVSEAHACKATLESLGRSLSSRERQIGSLKAQLKAAQDMHEETTTEADACGQGVRELLDNPSKVHEAAAQRLQRREARVKELAGNLQKYQWEAKYYQGLARDQRAFFLQGERISACGGAEALAKHPCGDVALVPRPPSMGNDKPEVWDIGTAIANPYVVDSWPFEPNVLANRTSKEATLQACTEETEEDLEEERRRLPHFAGMSSLRMPGRSLDDEDDYPGQTSTSRSL